MKQKVILGILAVVFFLLLVAGLVLSIMDVGKDGDSGDGKGQLSGYRETKPGDSTPAGSTPASGPDNTTEPGTPTLPGTVPGITTLPGVTTLPGTSTTVPGSTPPATTPPGPHTHTYQAVVTKPTMETEGYTTYTCACGHSFVGDKTPVLTLEQYINTLPLNPNTTGVNSVDKEIQSLLARGDTTYNKLLAVHNYLLNCSRRNLESNLAMMSAFAGNKVFRYATDLKISFDAHRLIVNEGGRAENFAAAFTVAARALGLESYVVSGTLNGNPHVWSQVVIGGKMYVFDAFRDQNVFAKLPEEAAGYAAGRVSTKTGFQSAGAFTLTLMVTSDDGTSSQTISWDVANAGKGNDDFLQCKTRLKLKGTVKYTITVAAVDGSVMIYDVTGIPEATTSASGTLNPAAGKYTILVVEQNSSRSFLIEIDN